MVNTWELNLPLSDKGSAESLTAPVLITSWQIKNPKVLLFFSHSPPPFEPRGGSIKKVIVEILTWEPQLWGKGRECGRKAKLSSLFCHFQSWYLAPPSDTTLYYTSFSFPLTPPQCPCVCFLCFVFGIDQLRTWENVCSTVALKAWLLLSCYTDWLWLWFFLFRLQFQSKCFILDQNLSSGFYCSKFLILTVQCVL